MPDKITDNQRITKEESGMIGFLQTIAILSVITAHVVSRVSTGGLRTAVTSVLSAWGCVGVAVFFVLGGFLYHREPGDTRSFWRKKLHSLILPWLVCSFLTYAIKVVTSHQLGLLDYCKWIFGYGTWYYYSTVYIIFLALFRFLKKYDTCLYAAIGINVISLIAATLSKAYLSVPYLSTYLNIFNWIGFFALGILIRKYRLDRKLLSAKWPLIVSAVLCAVMLGLMFLLDKWGYFSIFGMLFELSLAVVLLYIAKALSRSVKLIYIYIYIASIGKYAYCIYLLHMPIVQPICARLPGIWVFDLIKPLLGLAIMVCIIYIGKKICKLLPFGDTLCRLIGIRF